MELLRALASLVDPPAPEHRRIAEAVGLRALATADDYIDVIAFQAYPYGSVYLGADGMLGGEPRDRIAGFWRTLGVEPAHEPDHVSALLAGLAQLAEAEKECSPRQAAAVRRARHVLLWEHVASWIPALVATLRRIGHPFYTGWADVVEAAVVAQAEELGDAPRVTVALPVASERDTESLDDLLSTVLAPARVGFTIVRDDLVRIAGELGLGCRAGERRFVLRSLLAQDARAVLEGLAAEARRQADAYLASPLPTARTWSARARASADWLAVRAANAAEATGTAEVGDGSARCAPG